MSDNNIAEIFSRPNAEARIYDLDQFVLWADTPDRPGYRSRMVFGERNGAARITVFPNTEANAPILWVGMAPLVFVEFLDRFEAIARGEAGKAGKIANMGVGPQAERGKPPKESDMIIRNYLHYGKSQEGVCWLALEQNGSKNIRFSILPSMWHHFCKEDGSPIQPKEASVAQTLALIKSLRLGLAPYFARLRPLSEKAAARIAEGGQAAVGSAMTTFGEDVTFG